MFPLSSPAGRTTRIIDPDGDEDGRRYESSNTLPDLRSRMHEAKSSPEANREQMLRIRRSNIQLGDGRIKVLTIYCASGVFLKDGVCFVYSGCPRMTGSTFQVPVPRQSWSFEVKSGLQVACFLHAVQTSSGRDGWEFHCVYLAPLSSSSSSSFGCATYSLSGVQTLTTTQNDSMDEVVEATRNMQPGFNARVKQDPRYSSIKLGYSETENLVSAPDR